MKYQTKLIKQFEKDGYKVLKIIRLSENGYPDLMLLRDGEVIFIEVKEKTDTLKELQKAKINELRKLGFKAYCMQDGKNIVY
jgi:Holliday junction resolvase